MDIKKIIMYFSYQEKKKRKHQIYLKALAELENMSETELEAEYIDTKAKYAHLKITSSILGGAIFLAILGNIWGKFFYLIEGIFKLINHNPDKLEEGKIVIIVFLIVVIAMTVFIFLIALTSFKNLTNLYKHLLLIENFKEKRSR